VQLEREREREREPADVGGPGGVQLEREREGERACGRRWSRRRAARRGGTPRPRCPCRCPGSGTTLPVRAEPSHTTSFHTSWVKVGYAASGIGAEASQGLQRLYRGFTEGLQRFYRDFIWDVQRFKSVLQRLHKCFTEGFTEGLWKGVSTVPG
jgi:hypothetical protein